MDLKKLLVRSISGLLYVAIISVCCLSGTIGISVLATILACLATVEFAKMCRENESRNIPVVILDTVMCVLMANSVYVIPLIIWVACLIGRLVLELYMENPRPVKNLSHSLMAQIYIGVPLLLMTLIPVMAYMTLDDKWYANNSSWTMSFGPFLLVVFILIWINDTGAFLAGSLFGHHKLFERISPKKTWEGFFGGLIFNLIASALFCYFGGEQIPLFQGTLGFWLGLGTTVTIFGTWGDLVESLMKRSLDLKDSGNLIPGHGGILDRIDSLLLVAPAVFVYYLCFQLISVF